MKVKFHGKLPNLGTCLDLEPWGHTMHCWKTILKSKETVCWSVSLFEDLESSAHLLTSFQINFFSFSHMLGRPILEILFKSLFLTPKPQIKHITQQQKTSHGSICIFLEPWLQFCCPCSLTSQLPLQP